MGTMYASRDTAPQVKAPTLNLTPPFAHSYKFMAIAAADIKEPPIGGFAEVVTPSPGATLPIPKPNDTNPTADS